MGCGSSKTASVEGGGVKPSFNSSKSTDVDTASTSSTSRQMDIHQLATMHHHESRAQLASRDSAKRWIRLQGTVHSKMYTAWDNIELPVEDPSQDDAEDAEDAAFFDKFDKEQDDYNNFLSEDYAKCDTVVEWAPKILEKLEKDKTIRGDILREAQKQGNEHTEVRDRHVTVIYNPVGGGGKARTLVGSMVVPILQLTKHRFTVMPTKFRRHAVEILRNLDIDSTNAIIVCGGDGLVHEVITGYFLHPKLEKLKSSIPIGICPCGTANAMANALHTHKVRTQISIVGWAALAATLGQTKQVDVIKCIQQPFADHDVDKTNLSDSKKVKSQKKKQSDLTLHEREEVYALSCVGWGMAGAVALKADKLRWIPGQKSMRYDIAGFVSLISDWPITDTGVLEYREADGTPEGGKWKSEEISLINMICTNLDKQGKKYPIYPGVLPNDGRLVVLVVGSKASRRQVVKLGLAMKKGKWLGMQKEVKAYSLKEFKIRPSRFRSPYCIDGDPHDVSDIHVTNLERALSLFYIPAPAGEATSTAARMEGLPRKASDAQGLIANTATTSGGDENADAKSSASTDDVQDDDDIEAEAAKIEAQGQAKCSAPS